MTKLVADLIDSLKNKPDEWRKGFYVWRNITNSIEIWDVNLPIIDTTIYRPAEFKPNLYERYLLYKAIKECKRRKIEKALEK